MKKRVISMLLMLGLVGGVTAGCNKTEPLGGSMDQTANTTVEGDAEAGIETLDLYIDFSWYPSDNWEGIIPEEITKATGVNLNVTRAADSSQLGLMIASGELPDLVWTADSVDRLCDANMCYSYNELIDQYGIDWQPDEERMSIAKSHNANEEDENYYTILQNYNTKEEWSEFSAGVPSIPGLYYRKDIWKELGSPEMNTVDQIKDVMAMVKEQYPDIQVINAGNSGWRLKGFLNWYGVNGEFIYADDGTVIYEDTAPKYYDFLKCVNEFYRNGYYTEENLALNVEADAQQQAINGKSFIYDWTARPTWLNELNAKTKANIPEAEWAYLPIPDDSDPIIYANAGWAGVFISKNCKNPEAAIKLLSYLNSKEGQNLSLWGREGIDYQLDEDGIPQFSDEWKEANMDSTVMAEVYNTNLFCITEIHELSQYYSGLSREDMDSFRKNSDKIEFHPELALAIPKSTTDEGIIRAKIKEAKDAELVKIWTAPSEEDFEEAYQNYMNLLDKMGVQELNQSVTKSVQKIKKEFDF